MVPHLLLNYFQDLGFGLTITSEQAVCSDYDSTNCTTDSLQSALEQEAAQCCHVCSGKESKQYGFIMSQYN